MTQPFLGQIQPFGFGFARLDLQTAIVDHIDDQAMAFAHDVEVNLTAGDAHFAEADSTQPVGQNGPQSDDAVKGIGEVGGGFRFYFGQRWSLRTEVRAYLFPSSYKTGNDLTQPSSGNAHSYLAGIVTFAGGLSVLL